MTKPRPRRRLPTRHGRRALLSRATPMMGPRGPWAAVVGFPALQECGTDEAGGAQQSQKALTVARWRSSIEGEGCDGGDGVHAVAVEIVPDAASTGPRPRPPPSRQPRGRPRRPRFGSSALVDQRQRAQLLENAAPRRRKLAALAGEERLVEEFLGAMGERRFGQHVAELLAHGCTATSRAGRSQPPGVELT